jgi:abortive infection bacteriophage resistance protein
MTALKTWKSMEEQLVRLKQRGLSAGNDDAALSYLQRIGYYRLSGYWYPLRAIDEAASRREGRPIRLDEFVSDSRFEDVVRLYVFDKKLRLLAIDALERIEMAVRVDVAYLLGKRDPCAHENPTCLDGNFTKKRARSGPDAGRTGHEVWLDKYQTLVRRSRRLPFVAHHLNTYSGKLPIWVAIEVWDFGLLSRFFAGMRFGDQQAVATRYGAPDGKAFASWLRSLNFMRNVAAHHARMWNINVLEVAPLPKGWPEIPNAKPFFYFCLMQKLLRTICPNSTWGQRFRALLEGEFPELPSTAVSLRDIGLSQGWEQWDLWAPK